VGRGAEWVRAAFLRSASGIAGDEGLEESSSSRGWKCALESAMVAAIDGLEQGDKADDDIRQIDDGTKQPMEANYGAIVIFGSPGGRSRQRISTSRCAAIRPDIVEECFHRCVQRVRTCEVAK